MNKRPKYKVGDLLAYQPKASSYTIGLVMVVEKIINGYTVMWLWIKDGEQWRDLFLYTKWNISESGDNNAYTKLTPERI